VVFSDDMDKVLAGFVIANGALAMDMMGTNTDEFIDGVELGGVATFLEKALNARMTLFL